MIPDMRGTFVFVALVIFVFGFALAAILAKRFV